MLYNFFLNTRLPIRRFSFALVCFLCTTLLLSSCANIKKTADNNDSKADVTESRKKVTYALGDDSPDLADEDNGAGTEVSENVEDNAPEDSELILIRPSDPSSNARPPAQQRNSTQVSSVSTADGELAADDDILDRIRQQLGKQINLKTNHPQVRAQLEWYAKNQEFLDRSFIRSTRYLHYVVGEVEKRNMPMEVALLPFVESAYNPFAYSSGRASGIWQFISGTGKIYGLEQNWWYDGRRDILASTKAALDYLEYLNKLFDGDWLHALAAYNSGSGRVTREIAKNKKKKLPIDFWSLNLPKETRSYVPFLIAMSKLVKNPAQYGVTLPSIPDKPYFAIVKTQSQIDLSQAAGLAGIDVEEMYQLNPGFNQWATDPLGPHRLLVPVEHAETLAASLKTLPANTRVNWNRYTVQRGDTLAKIARKFQTTPDLILSMNQLKNGTLKEKQTLLIPTSPKDKGSYDAGNIMTGQNRILNPQDITRVDHLVKQGDTLQQLARAHRVAVRDIARWNRMAPNAPLAAGSTLLIWSRQAIGLAKPLITNPAASLASERQLVRRIGYQVKKGDTLSHIARKFNVSVNNLLSWNKLSKKKVLKPGQKLTILVDMNKG